jgi:uncharacterized delta-60 repeat protein
MSPRRTAILALVVGAVLVPALAVARATAPGDLDPTFDGDGKETIDYGGYGALHDAVVRGDGKIVVVGFQTTGAPYEELAVSRLNPDGSFDTSFDTDGTVAVDVDLGDDAGIAVALQRDGKIVVAGRTGFVRSPNPTADVAVIRLNTDGSLDAQFDGDGKRTIDWHGVSDAAYGVMVQPDGKIVVAGSDGYPRWDLVASRLNTDGSLDTSFDADGTVTVDFGGEDEGIAAALRPDGRIVVAGGRNGDELVKRWPRQRPPPWR